MNYNLSPKQEQSFPEACKIRKGLPKVEMKKGDFKFFGITNFHDLKDRFRFEFQEGVGEIRTDYQTKIERKDWNLKEIFHSLHASEYVKYDLTHKRPGTYASPDGFELKTIRAMIPCFSVLDAFYWANVANNAGTQIAVANDEQYISEKNPLNTREYIVKNGQPFKAWKNGEIISYKKGDKIATLPFKTDIRLSLFMPELERFVYFTLKSTSYYDRLQMQAHLNGIQFWANTLNGGNAAGIPLLIYRKEQAVTWNKPDGSAQQTKQWLINIEADPAWVKYASEKMSRFAFGEGAAQKMLSAPPPAVPLVGEYDPAAPDEEGEFEDLGDQPETATPIIITGQVEEIPSATTTPPASKAMPRAGSSPSTPERTAAMAKFSAAWNLAAKDKLITPESQKIWGVSGSSTVDEIEAKTALIYTAIAARGEEKQNPPA